MWRLSGANALTKKLQGRSEQDVQVNACGCSAGINAYAFLA